MPSFFKGGAFCALAATCLPLTLPAQTDAESTVKLTPLEVRGRADDLLGTASSSSEGWVGSVDLSARPFLRRGELLEVVPGVVITQHSGGGKANQYFLRGFNLDHGTDFSVSVDGMPVNMRTHAHGQGYTDLNFIIPELVQSVAYSKGPYDAEKGDFSSAGAAQFNLVQRLSQPFATIEAGENRYYRLVSGGSYSSGPQSVLTAGLEYSHDDGPWVKGDAMTRRNAFLRHVWTPATGRTLSLTAMAFSSAWNASDQIPLRALTSGDVDRFGTVDPTCGGDTERVSLSAAFELREPEHATEFTAYALHYNLDLYSNFTYFLEDPVDGDQFNQRDRRNVIGLNVRHLRHFDFGGRPAEWVVGGQARGDFIGDVELRHTKARSLLHTLRADKVQELSVGLFSHVETRWNDWLRSNAGLRYDAYGFDVTSDNALNSGNRSAGIASPKLGIVASPCKQAEFYLIGGLGFHSNDARGTTIRVDPADGVTPVEEVSPLVRSKGAEFGVRLSPVKGWVSTVSFWALELDSELVFVGDAGGTEASGATRRHGVEWANFWQVKPWLAFDADLSLSHARYKDEPVADRVANSIARVITAGVVVGRNEGPFASVRLRHFGPQPLIEDNSVTSPSSTLLNARVGWRKENWEVALSVLNVADTETSDIAYFYTSRLPGEDDAGVDDIHLHPAEPRTFRLAVTYRF